MSDQTQSGTSSHPAVVTVGQYLATRLVQLGADHVFGLPGDFNLSLLDQMVTVDGFTWVGSTNELNAAYAADGYARLRRGIGALVTTFGVGELSAINGVAGSFSEDVPVVKITGMPSTTARAAGLHLHHTLIDGDYDHFFRAYREVTASATIVKAATATRDIDAALMTALRESKPVYLGIPADVAVAPVPSANLRSPLVAATSDAGELARFTAALEEAVAEHPRVTLLVGPQVHRTSQEPLIRSIADHDGVYVASQNMSKAVLDESHPASLGTYMGAFTRIEEARDAVDQAPLLVLAGTVMSDFLTGFFTQRFDEQQAVELGLTSARIADTTFYGVRLTDSLAALHEVLGRSERPAVVPVGHPPVPDADAPVPGKALSQEYFWGAVQNWLRPGTTVIADAGTSFYGALDLVLPDDSALLGQPVWSAIGYTVPATLGACVAAPGHRAVLFVGDGAAQLTVQELATILHRGFTPVIFLLNNDGYTVERKIQSPSAVYQDITPWDWTLIPAALGAGDRVLTTTARTEDELADALSLAHSADDKAVLVEVVLPKLDSPRLLTVLTDAIAAAAKAAAAR
ncbi:thiamine pyrophosphate-binding protein [Herbiconiux sp. KACC 21604]|uniref:alpha-keto acid decarboxylase family protein n=1 Tax=unclassified Herbiconiux TaxID=2618217 RepID=UPI001491DFF7|nr:thiamine pyrophosphate-binding protein [Herbiconiux sp. SALV-R1]QJU54034.1 alpha-keto acid decarboxylase family protein [Herbiconiux sp. SALV-R1]WPO85070.1 thiamine pyrophosphate-binding protein [Herbiconiux sp. KACC 21604]